MNALIKVAIVTLNLLFFLNLNAAYLTDVPVTVTQPDGIVLNIFATGDEFYNWLHDANNYTIVQDETNGYYCYAELVNGQLVPTDILPGINDPELNGLTPAINLPPEVLSQTIDIFTENTPASITRTDFLNAQGQVTLNNLVVYIRFADQIEFTETQNFYSDMFNKTGAGVNSVTDYFKEASYGKLNVNSTFYPANDATTVLSYEDDKDRGYYAPYHSITNPIGYTGATLAEFKEERRKENTI